MIEITHFSEDYKNVHFKSLFKDDLKIEVLIYKESDLINSFNIDVNQMSEYWVSINEGLGDKKVVFRDRKTKEILLEKDYRKKVVLIQLWFGKIPDYFWYHYETTKNFKNVDFLFVTDQNVNLDASNYRVIKTNIDTVVDKVSDLLGTKIQLKSNKKTCDLKASLGDIFSEYIMDYEYFGCYDIDTLFGDFEKYVQPLLGEYDIISVGDETYHNRLSGPFLIMKNTQELRTFYRTNEFIKCFESVDVECYEENVMDRLVKDKFTIKLICSMNTSPLGKNIYDCTWTGGKNFINGEEIFLYHFYRKNHTIFQKVGNQIFGRYNKIFIEDFYWVFGFTENYSKTIPYLMDSIHKYSNRKCVIYSINFDYNIPQKFLTSGQFIFKRINIPEGKKDERGRDENIISCKPKLMLDVLNFLPNKNFIFIDSDVSLTVVADDIGKYFSKMKNYPLINSHTHDKIYLTNLVEGEEWTSTIDIIANKVGVEVCVFPRRKTNIMLFDKNSKWFFEEQICLYETYKNSEPGIFAFHDEDSANLILSKYKLHNCLHLCDIEECDNIDMNKFTDTNHPFHQTRLSEYLVLPKHQNDVVFFHGLKDENRFKSIEKVYGNTVLDCEEILVTYIGDTIFFEKNSFLKGKDILNEVDFKVYDLKGNLITELNNQLINNYWTFYVSGIDLNTEEIIIKINESENGRTIYRNVIKTK